jgi:4-cresol dehydrogenase (hydroxylating) cytochrome subunit
MKHLAVAALLASIAGAAVAADPGHIGPGQRFFDKTCAKCHTAGVGPELRGRNLPPEYFVAIARNGLNAMPSFRITDIDDATLLDVGKYLSTSTVPAAPAAAKP